MACLCSQIFVFGFQNKSITVCSQSRTALLRRIRRLRRLCSENRTRSHKMRRDQPGIGRHGIDRAPQDERGQRPPDWQNELMNVFIVGAGLIGSATARWRLAQAGTHVTLADAGRFGGETELGWRRHALAGRRIRPPFGCGSTWESKACECIRRLSMSFAPKQECRSISSLADAVLSSPPTRRGRARRFSLPAEFGSRSHPMASFIRRTDSSTLPTCCARSGTPARQAAS